MSRPARKRRKTESKMRSGSIRQGQAKRRPYMREKNKRMERGGESNGKGREEDRAVPAPSPYLPPQKEKEPTYVFVAREGDRCI